jgi:hypothetical protein
MQTRNRLAARHCLDPASRPNTTEPSQLRDAALARWDAEGGAGPGLPRQGAGAQTLQPGLPVLTETEWYQLRVRLIALENLLLSVLVDASGPLPDIAREMAVYISPRSGFTNHPLTTHAAAQMVHLVRRADDFRRSPTVRVRLPKG